MQERPLAYENAAILVLLDQSKDGEMSSFWSKQ